MNKLNKTQEIYYSQNYKFMMKSGLTGRLFNHANRMIERQFTNSDHFNKILELGASNYWHLQFVKCNYSEYHVTDLQKIDEPEMAFFEENIKNRILDATQLSKEKTDEYDRIIATCLVLHLDNLEDALIQWRRITRNGGYISIYVHCEPGVLLRLTRTLIQLPKSRKIKNYNHYDLVYLEHKLHYLNVKHTINKVFAHDEIHQKFFPFGFASWNFNYWKIYTIQINKN